MFRYLRIVRQRLRSLWRRKATDEELARELAFHYEALVCEYEADGLSAEAARLAARRAIGNVTLFTEQCREVRRVPLLADLTQDVRFGLRMMRRSPGLTAVAVLSLAVAIGGSTAVAGALHATLVESLPFPDAESLVLLRTTPPGNPGAHTHASLPHFVAWEAQTQSFAAMGASIADQRRLALQDGAPIEAEGQAFTPGLFATLGVAPALGRLFTEAEAEFGRVAPVILISDRLWRLHFGADPGIVGTEVLLNREPATIIGVMPPGFSYPHHRPDFWSPLTVPRSQMEGSTRLYTVTARLLPGVSLEQARVDLDAVTKRLAQTDSARYGADGAFIWPLREAWFGWAQGPLLTLSAAVALVLLIACANVAALLLARATVRAPELTMRAALGAGRGRVVRQLLTESVLLAVAGGALGLLVAWLGLRAITMLGGPPGSMELGTVILSLPLVGVTLALSVAAGLLFGLAPAIVAMQGGGAGLRDPRGTAIWRLVRGLDGYRLRETLVTAQLALAIVLLAAFGLLMHSFVRLAGRDLHFDPSGLLTFEYRIPPGEYTHHLGTYRGLPYVAIDPHPSMMLQRVHERLRELPGVQAVAGISAQHVGGLVVPSVTVLPEGAMATAADRAPHLGLWSPDRALDTATVDAAYFQVTPGFFTTMRATIVQGRDIAASDTADRPLAVVVNETAARRLWPQDDPIGKRLTLDISPEAPLWEVVGVARDMPLRRRLTDPAPVVYTSYLQQPSQIRSTVGNMAGRLVFVIRHPGDPLALVPDVRRAVSSVDPLHPIDRFSTVSQQLDAQIVPSFYYVFGVGLFAVIAVGLAAVGLYGTMAYVVAQRTREIGIRAALGAGAREILVLAGGRALRVIAVGVATGLAGALAVGQLIAAQLWDVRPTDPLTLGAVALLFALVVALACFVPVRRALAVDPSVTLRAE